MYLIMKYWPFLLLVVSNVFMTFAWYGNLKFKNATMPLFIIILISWGIAFFEYCFMIPANRIASKNFDTAQLKIIQEAITLVVFGVFSVLYLKESFSLIIYYHLFALSVLYFSHLRSFDIEVTQ